MNEFKKFIKNEDDNWEEYKDLINEDTKFMMRDEDGTEIEMTPAEVINQLYQDNKTLEHYIYNLQFKIDKVNELLEELEHNQNINLEKGLENRVNVDYIIERLNDCIGDDK